MKQETLTSVKNSVYAVVETSEILLSSGCGRLRLCQSWTADQRPGGRDLRQAARSTQHDIRGREESEPLFGCSGGENLTGNEDFWMLVM